MADYNLNELYDTETTELTSDLVDELCQEYGIPCYYLKKTNVNLDRVFGSDDLQKYESATNILLLPENPSFFGGSGDIFGKFGIEGFDSMTMFIEINRFQTEISKTTPETDDILYIPVFNSWYQVTFDDDEGDDNSDALFYANGELSAFKINLMKYEYSHEDITATAVASYLPDYENQTNDDNDVIDSVEQEDMVIDDFDDIFED